MNFNPEDFEAALQRVRDIGLWERLRLVESGCWEWPATGGAYGYGRIYSDGRNIPTHRLAYRLMNGPIGDGLVIDHLCRNPKCSNPEHLEPVTTRVNNQRSISATKTHCTKGHEFNTANTGRTSIGGRRCMECHRIESRAVFRRERAAKRIGTDKGAFRR